MFALSRTWLVLACVLIFLESAFLYEAFLADLAGYEKLFGVFVGLAVVSFAALVYAVRLIFYD